jgi:nitroreductase
MTVTEALEIRRSVPSFSPDVEIDQSQLRGLIEQASLAPSSMNLQPWRFIVCQSSESKATLKAASYNQKKIVESSAAIIVVGNLDQHLNAVELSKHLPADRAESYRNGAFNGWNEKPQAQRDEAFRGGNLWAMTFMLVATEAGWDTAPMGGYVPEQITAEFGLSDREIPVLIIAIGKRNPEVQLFPRAHRFPSAETTEFK